MTVFVVETETEYEPGQFLGVGGSESAAHGIALRYIERTCDKFVRDGLVYRRHEDLVNHSVVIHEEPVEE